MWDTFRASGQSGPPAEPRGFDIEGNSSSIGGNDPFSGRPPPPMPQDTIDWRMLAAIVGAGGALGAGAGALTSKNKARGAVRGGLAGLGAGAGGLAGLALGGDALGGGWGALASGGLGALAGGGLGYGLGSIGG